MSWPTIPDPGGDLASLIQPIRAMKNLLEILTGQRGGGDAPMARVFRGVIRPGAANSTVGVSQLKDGDLWIDAGNLAKLYYWDAALKNWSPTT